MLIIPVLVGANTVICRYLNAAYAKHNSLAMGTLVNYVTGLIASLAVLLILGGTAQLPPLGPVTFRTVMMFLGGAFGVAMIQLFIYITPRMPAFTGTMLIFLSQLGAGFALDFILTGAFSAGKLLGGLVVLCGLAHFQWVEEREAAREKCDPVKS